MDREVRNTMSIYETNDRGLSRKEWAVVIAAIILGALVASCFGRPVPAQSGAAPPPPPPGYAYRYQLGDGPLPDWIVVMQEALALRRTALDEFVAAGEASARAAISSAQTDTDPAIANLQLRGFRLIAVELADVARRPDPRSPEVGWLILQRIETGAYGVFTDAEREALAQAAFDFCRQVIAEEAAIRAAQWASQSSTAIDIPSDLGSPVILG